MSPGGWARVAAPASTVPSGADAAPVPVGLQELSARRCPKNWLGMRRTTRVRSPRPAPSAPPPARSSSHLAGKKRSRKTATMPTRSNRTCVRYWPLCGVLCQAAVFAAPRARRCGRATGARAPLGAFAESSLLAFGASWPALGAKERRTMPRAEPTRSARQAWTAAYVGWAKQSSETQPPFKAGVAAMLQISTAVLYLSVLRLRPSMVCEAAGLDDALWSNMEAPW